MNAIIKRVYVKWSYKKRTKKNKLKSECWALIWICYLILNACITTCARKHLSTLYANQIYVISYTVWLVIHNIFFCSFFSSFSFNLLGLHRSYMRFTAFNVCTKYCARKVMVFWTKTKVWRKNDMPFGFSCSVFRSTLNSLETFLFTSREIRVNIKCN